MKISYALKLNLDHLIAQIKKPLLYFNKLLIEKFGDKILKILIVTKI